MKKTMGNAVIVTAVGEHRVRNQQLRTRFEQQKVNLDEPRAIDFHFWAWTQRDAAVLARELYQIGFLVRLLAPAPADGDPDRWSVEGGTKIPLSQALGDELTERLVKIAAEEEAVFDGWGTSV